MTLAELVERLRRIPTGVRSYEWDARQADLHFGLDDALLHRLADLGLPCARGDDGLRFAHVDLHYVGLRLGTASTYLWAARQWAESLERLAAREDAHLTVGYVPQLPGVESAVTGWVRLPSGEPRAVVLENGRCAVEAPLALDARWPLLPVAARRVVSRVAAQLDFCLVPAGLRGNVALVRRIGLSDCLTAAHVLVEEWRAGGLDARLGSGILVSVPYSTPHTWAEVRVGERWVPADPLMLGVMRDYGGLDAGRWPLDRSLGPALTRLGERPSPLAWDERGPVELTLMTAE